MVSGIASVWYEFKSGSKSRVYDDAHSHTAIHGVITLVFASNMWRDETRNDWASFAFKINCQYGLFTSNVRYHQPRSLCTPNSNVRRCGKPGVCIKHCPNAQVTLNLA